MSAPATTQFPITASSEKTNAFWGCRNCEDGGKGDHSAINAAKHRRATNHATWWEFHSKGNFPSIDAERALKIVTSPPATLKPRVTPPRKTPPTRDMSPRTDRLQAEERVRATEAPYGLTVVNLMEILGLTYHQANALRIYWLEKGIFTHQRFGRQWRVFPS